MVMMKLQRYCGNWEGAKHENHQNICVRNEYLPAGAEWSTQCILVLCQTLSIGQRIPLIKFRPRCRNRCFNNKEYRNHCE